jgi:hypothetical protein
LQIKNIILPLFIKKLSFHKHAKAFKSTCNFSWVADGLWKTTRFRCINSDKETDRNTNEFKKIDLGCNNSPSLNSYYCSKHSGYELKFKYNGHLISINPTFISKLRLGK